VSQGIDWLHQEKFLVNKQRGNKLETNELAIKAGRLKAYQQVLGILLGEITDSPLSPAEYAVAYKLVENIRAKVMLLVSESY